jgi:thiosulfate/3-mercaptopyruvate sulfurtransferase
MPALPGLAAISLPQPIVSAEWLAAHLDAAADGRLVVVDSRWYLDGRSGLAAYQGGHILHAQWVDLDTELSGPGSPEEGRHPLPHPAQFAAAMARLGIGDDTAVVVYDDARGSIAGRLWWLLRSLDHPVAVLDGGLQAWSGPLTTEAAVTSPPSTEPFTERPWPPARFVGPDAVEARRKDEHALVLDARAAARYEQGDLSIDPRRGHIPGARSAPWADNVDETGRWRHPSELRRRFGALGAEQAETITAYCGSGVTACHDLLALEIAGLGDHSALYTGSWSQWGADITRPALTGPDRP